MDKSIKVKSLYKAVKLLDLFDARHPERGIKELADLTGMLKSSAYNIVNTFQVCGVIEKNPKTGKYKLGKKILEWSNILLNNDELRQLVKPRIDELAEECHETVYFGIPSDTEVIYIECAYPKDSMFARSITGVKAEMYCTGIGKAMLAFLDEERLQRVVADGLKAYTPHTLTDEKTLRRDLEQTRERGYAIDNMEHEYGIRCVGVPLRNSRDEVVGALSISGPSLRMMDDRLPYFAEQLQKTADTLRPVI